MKLTACKIREITKLYKKDYKKEVNMFAQQFVDLHNSLETELEKNLLIKNCEFPVDLLNQIKPYLK